MIKTFFCVLALALSLFLTACDPLFVPDAPPSPTPTHARQAPTQYIYIVRDGDTLQSIAIALHIRGGWQALYNANRQVIDTTSHQRNPAGNTENNIFPGERLIVP